jgi:hypothetical protein
VRGGLFRAPHGDPAHGTTWVVRAENLEGNTMNDKLVVEITQKIGSEPAKVFSTAFAAATDDPEDSAFVATIAWICANERLSARDRLEDVVKIVNLARLA